MNTSAPESTEKTMLQKFWARITTLEPDHIHSKIMSFGRLPEGWDYGQGIPSSKQVVQKALEVFSLAKLLGFVTEPQPTTEGGIVMILSKGDYFLDVVINPDLTLDTRLEKGIGSEYEVLSEQEDVSKADVLRLLDYTKQLYLECLSSAHYTRTSIARQSTGSLQNTLDPTAVEFQYSMQGVLC